MNCEHWDGGWCYKPRTQHKDGCVGPDECKERVFFRSEPRVYKKDKDTTNKWALRFQDLAATVAKWSKDPVTKVGAVAVDDANRVVETGFNGLPRGVSDLPERMERPAKYLWTAHAEENLVAHAARATLAGTTVHVTHLCCNNCARMLINSGVAKVVTGNGGTSMPPEQFEVAKAMFKEANVELIYAP